MNKSTTALLIGIQHWLWPIFIKSFL